MTKDDKVAVVWSEARSYNCSPRRPWFFLHIPGTFEGCWNRNKLFVVKCCSIDRWKLVDVFTKD